MDSTVTAEPELHQRAAEWIGQERRGGVEGVEMLPQPDDGQTPDLLETARAFRKMHVFPIPLRNNKRPLLKNWLESPWSQRAAAFGSGRASAIGVQTGMRRGDTGLSLVVLDFDDMVDFDRLCDENTGFRRLAAIAPIARTSRGVHVWLYVRGEVRSRHFRNRAGGGRKYAVEYEIKARGNYVETPPSPGKSWLRSPFDTAIPTLEDHRILPYWDGPEPEERAPKTTAGKISQARETHRELAQEQARKDLRPERREAPNAPGDNEYSANLRGGSVCVHGRGSSVVLSPMAVRIIGGHVPSGAGQRNDTLFRMAGALNNAGLSVESLRQHAELIVSHWLRLAEPYIRTKDFKFNLDAFLYGLNNLRPRARRASPDVDRLPSDTEDAQVVAFADANPIDAGGRGGERGGRNKVAALLRAKAHIRGYREFSIDQRTLGRMYGASGAAAAKHISKLVERGFIEIIDRGKSGKDGQPRSSARYRWIGPPIDEATSTELKQRETNHDRDPYPSSSPSQNARIRSQRADRPSAGETLARR